MKTCSLENDKFLVEIDHATGGIVSIQHPRNPMNWVVDPRESGQIERSHCWGLGYAGMGTGIFWGRSAWDDPLHIDAGKNRIHCHYEVSGLSISVERILEPDHLQESYTFALTEDRQHTMGGDADGAFGIYIPWNDNYPDSATCLSERCHAHVWTGGADAWVCGLRMNGVGPHLGLVLQEGALEAYSIVDRDGCRSSNHRGVIVVHPSACVMTKGTSRTISWRLFWHGGKQEFQQALDQRSDPRLDADKLVSIGREPILLKVEAGALARDVNLVAGGKPLDLVGTGSIRHAEFRPELLGPHTIRVSVDGRSSRAEVFASPSVDDLLTARSRFIARNQQVLDKGPYYGAFAPYDNETESIIYFPGESNQSCGGEQIGMGVLIALHLLRSGKFEAELGSSLHRHYRFVKEQLHREDGMVLYFPCQGADEHLRLYNFPWVAQYHLAMARLGEGVDAIRSAASVMRSYYQNGGAEFLALSLPMLPLVKACLKSGLASEASEMEQMLLRHAEWVLQIGTNYPSHEVAYEQSIVAPACEILLQAYQLSGNRRYLEALKPHLQCLEAFHGNQPSFHMREVAVRHWDGFWFGKRKLWGDTFPHYWSTLSALVFARYSVVSNDASYATRAWTCLRANLSLFGVDGRASCAHIYPLTVNGARAACDDPLANDQDWALIHWLWVEEILSERCSGSMKPGQRTLKHRTLCDSSSSRA